MNIKNAARTIRTLTKIMNQEQEKTMPQDKLNPPADLLVLAASRKCLKDLKHLDTLKALHHFATEIDERKKFLDKNVELDPQGLRRLILDELRILWISVYEGSTEAQ